MLPNSTHFITLDVFSKELKSVVAKFTRVFVNLETLFTHTKFKIIQQSFFWDCITQNFVRFKLHKKALPMLPNFIRKLINKFPKKTL